MKGHILQLLEEFIIKQMGDAQYQKVLTQCSFDTSTGFIRTETYPDENLFELVGHVCDVMQITIEQAQQAFGEWVLPRLIDMLPTGAEPYPTAQSFLEHLSDIHRVELKKLYPDAEPPAFEYQHSDQNESLLIYYSKRKMFPLVEGCLRAVSTFWQQPLSFRVQPDADDDNRCIFYIVYVAP